MSRSSGRGQVEPLAALAAVAAVCAGLALYVGALDDARPAESETRIAQTVADRIAGKAGELGAIDPDAIRDYGTDLPDGYRANVTLRTAAGTWHAGPRPPGSALRAERDVSVRSAPARIGPGRLSVVVWS